MTDPTKTADDDQAPSWAQRFQEQYDAAVKALEPSGSRNPAVAQAHATLALAAAVRDVGSSLMMHGLVSALGPLAQMFGIGRRPAAPGPADQPPSDEQVAESDGLSPEELAQLTGDADPLPEPPAP
jgi:hypothetical protein